MSLDPQVRDRYGLPVVRLSGTMHSETVRTARFMVERAGKWIHANGVLKTWGTLRSLSLSGGPHYVCTPSMGDDPDSSVLDRHRRIYGYDYL